ncbi:MAG: hypothetical protein CMJ65_10005, partial [Planctomycetaceae bacterium]|nr:hypothetical protein [Planctomycetaceae bacterium]
MADGEFKIDQYTVIGDIATGQVSDVFEVMEEGTGNRFALKLIREEIVTDPTSKGPKVILSQFKQEFKLGEMLEHPNLVSVHDFKMKIQVLLPIKDPIAYFTMDYFRSQNLKTFMTADLSNAQRKLQRLLEQICEAVGYIHSKGWVHRDIKPDNLLMTKSAEARVIDLSLAMKINKRSKIIQGTRTYIAPETIKKQKAVPQTDIYSLGITIYEVLTGQVPFTGTSPTELLKRHIATKPAPPSELNSNVAPELDRLVAKMLAKKPADRHESMEDLLADIRNTRFFLEEIAETEIEEDPEEDVKSLVKTLDSRADAKRSRSLKDNPELAEQWAAEREAQEARRTQKRGATVNDSRPVAPETPAPATTQPTPQPTPSMPAAPAPMPGMPMPGMPMPGMPMPGMPMPGMPM